MINESFYKLFGKKEYNELLQNKIKSNLSIMTMASSAILLSDTFPMINNIALLANTLSITKMYLYEKINPEMYSKEIIEIKKVYDKVIDNISKINKIFGLTEPVEIYTMFTCALNNGYLSKDKKFIQDDSEIRNIRTIYGAIPITGKGVCRHIGPMLCDIMKKSNIESNAMTVYQKTIIGQIDIKNYIDDLKKEIDKLIEENNKYEKIKKKYGNHVITLAIKNGKIHLLDPTQEKIYKVSKTDKKLIIDKSKDITNVLAQKETFLGTKEELKKQEKHLTLPCTTFEEDEKLVKRTTSLFNNNLDILDILYNTNKELYEEISDKLLKFKR